MYFSKLNNHLSLHNQTNFSEVSDCILSLSSSIHLGAEGGGGRTSLDDIVLILLYFCKYMSKDYLVRYLGMSDSYARILLHRLAKLGYIDVVNLKKRDSYSGALYYSSRRGDRRVEGLLELPHRKSLGSNTSALSDTVSHDYALGICVLSMILNSHSSLDFIPEQNLVDRFSQVGAVSFRPDSICRAKDMSGYTYIYFEQDMGTEPVTTLLSKLLSYCLSDFIDTDINSLMVLSFRNKEVLPIRTKLCAPSENHSKLCVMSDMLCTIDSLLPIHTLNDFLNLISSDDFLTSYPSISNWIEANYNNLSDGGKTILSEFKDTYADWDEVRSYVTAVVNILSDAFMSGFPTKNNQISFTDFEKYVSDLKRHTNPYVNYPYNQKQLNFSYARQSTLIDYLDRCMSLSTAIEGAGTGYVEVGAKALRDKITMGMSCWCLPTELMSNYVHYLTPAANRVYLNCLGLLKILLPFKDDNEDYTSDYWKAYYDTHFHTRYTVSLSPSDEPMVLRNVLILPNNEIVSFEHLHDIGGWYRSLFFFEKLNDIANKDNVWFCNATTDEYGNPKLVTDGLPSHIHLMIVTDTLSRASSFLKRYKVSNAYMRAAFYEDALSYHTCNFVLESALYNSRENLVEFTKSGARFVKSPDNSTEYFLGNYNYPIRNDKQGPYERRPLENYRSIFVDTEEG